MGAFHLQVVRNDLGGRLFRSSIYFHEVTCLLLDDSSTTLIYLGPLVIPRSCKRPVARS